MILLVLTILSLQTRAYNLGGHVKLEYDIKGKERYCEKYGSVVSQISKKEWEEMQNA